MGTAQVVHWLSSDGAPLDGTLLLPSEYRAGERYPLVVVVYGGAYLSAGFARFGSWASGPFNLQLLANRFGQRKQFHWKKAQEALGLPFAEWIPDDPGAINNALNLGQPLIHSDSNSKIAQEIRRLAKVLMGESAAMVEPSARRPFWSGLLRREQPQLDLQTTLGKV